MTRTRLIVTGFVVLLLAIGGNLYIGLHGESRQGRDERTTCTIQSRGLKAQPHLTTVMGEIEKLLAPIPGRKAQPIPPTLVKPLNGLRYHLHAYVEIEAGQPKKRRC